MTDSHPGDAWDILNRALERSRQETPGAPVRMRYAVLPGEHIASTRHAEADELAENLGKILSERFPAQKGRGS